MRRKINRRNRSRENANGTLVDKGIKIYHIFVFKKGKKQFECVEKNSNICRKSFKNF